MNFKYLHRPINNVTISMYNPNHSYIGYCKFNQNYLYNFNIFHQYRGFGLSKLLLKNAINYNKYTYISLHVLKTNSIALNLYLQNGFIIHSSNHHLLYLIRPPSPF